jgi:hypothetical protein
MNDDLWSGEVRGNGRSRAEGEGTGQIKTLLDQKEKPIGVRIPGPEAGDLMAEWVAVLNGKVKLAALAAGSPSMPDHGRDQQAAGPKSSLRKNFLGKSAQGTQTPFSVQGQSVQAAGSELGGKPRCERNVPRAEAMPS